MRGDDILIQNENNAFAHWFGTNIETNSYGYKDEIIPGEIEYKIVQIDHDYATIGYGTVVVANEFKFKNIN